MTPKKSKKGMTTAPATAPKGADKGAKSGASKRSVKSARGKAKPPQRQVASPKGRGRQSSSAVKAPTSNAKRKNVGEEEQPSPTKRARDGTPAATTDADGPGGEAAARVPAQGQQEQQHDVGAADVDEDESDGVSVTYESSGDDDGNADTAAPAAAAGGGGDPADPVPASGGDIVISGEGLVTAEGEMSFEDFSNEMTQLIEASDTTSKEAETKLIQKYPVLVARFLRMTMQQLQSRTTANSPGLSAGHSGGLSAQHSGPQELDEGLDSGAGADDASDIGSRLSDSNSMSHLPSQTREAPTGAGTQASPPGGAPARAPATAGVPSTPGSNASMQQQVQSYIGKSKKEQNKFLSAIKATLQGLPTSHEAASANITVGAEDKCTLPNLQQLLQQDHADGGHKSILTSSVSLHQLHYTTCTPLRCEHTLTLVARFPCSPSSNKSAWQTSRRPCRRSTKSCCEPTT